ncbi:MAG: hypothetical protein V1748_02750 [Actinomycetota bacterium]
MSKLLGFCLVTASVYVLAVPVVMFIMEKSIVRRVEPARPDEDFLDAWPPALAGFVLFQKVKRQYITATIIDLANRGFLMVEEMGHGLLNTFEFDSTGQSLKGLNRYEHDLLREMFPGRTKEVSEVSLFKKLPAFLPKLYERITEEVEKRKVFSDKSALREVSFPYFASVSGAVMLGLVILDILYDKPAVWILVAALAIGIIEVGVFAHRVPRLTGRGKEVYVRLLSFGKYLDELDHDSPDEELIGFLPYALAFHSEPFRARKFARVEPEYVPWYVSEDREEDNLLPLIHAANSMQCQISGEPAIFSYWGWLTTYGSSGYDRPKKPGSFLGFWSLHSGRKPSKRSSRRQCRASITSSSVEPVNIKKKQSHRKGRGR